MTELPLLYGGLLSRSMRGLGLSDRAWVRGLAFFLVAWLPIAVLSTLEGRAVGSVDKPFFFDYGVYGRLLIALPLLVIAQVPVRKRAHDVLRGFVTSNLIKAGDLQRYHDSIEVAAARTDSVLPDIIALSAIYFATALRVYQVLSEPMTTWYYSGDSLTAAGWYYVVVSVPLFQFLLVRWVWVMAVWTVLLWRISRLDLQLLPIHPDGMGGLGFIGLAQVPYAIIGFAGGAVISAYLINGMVYQGGSLSRSVAPMLGYVLLATLLILAPAFTFTDRLVGVRAKGLLKYGDIGEDYARQFDDKWARGMNPDNEIILGSSDIQSLADLRNSFIIVQNISAIPVDRRTMTIIAVTSAIPMLPLLFLTLPVEEIVMRLLGLAGF